MGAVTKWFVAGFLAAAPGHFLGSVEGHFEGHHAGVFGAVRAVAKRLLGGFSAGAPGVCAGLHVLHERAVLFGAHEVILRGDVRSYLTSGLLFNPAVTGGVKNHEIK